MKSDFGCLTVSPYRLTFTLMHLPSWLYVCVLSVLVGFFGSFELCCLLFLLFSGWCFFASAFI